MGKLILMCGVPGSGKTTFCKNHLTENDVHISRDEVRFSLLKDGEAYFAHEDEVYKEFWRRINEALASGKNVFADQTNLTPRARKYLLDNVTGYDEADCLWFKCSVQFCLNNNEKRKGISRTYVPRNVIRRMSEQFVSPTHDEGFAHVWVYYPERHPIGGKN